MHPRDHVKLSTAGPTDDFGPSRDLAQGHERRLLPEQQNADDTPISDGPFLHRAMDRRPAEFVYGAPAGERRHAIDETHPEHWNTPPWFQMLGQRS